MPNKLSKKVLNVIAKINERYGENSLVLFSSTDTYNIKYMSTGVKSLDDALGGGLPKASIVELYGQPQSGKSTLTMMMIAEVQKNGGVAAYFDAEHGFDPAWAIRYGVDTDSLIFSQPDNGEQAINSSISLIRAGLDLIVIDSVSALTPSEELEAEEGVEAHKMALLARMMSKSMRLMLTALKGRDTVIIFINQFTTNIGVMYGEQLITKGGLALKQASRVRLEVARAEWIKHPAAEKAGIKQGKIGQRVQIRVTKSKVSSPYKTA